MQVCLLYLYPQIKDLMDTPGMKSAVLRREEGEYRSIFLVEEPDEYQHRMLGYPVYWMNVDGKGKGLLAINRNFKETSTSAIKVKYLFYRLIVD